MTDQQHKFLELVILDQTSYAEISKLLAVDPKILSAWWEEFRSEREKLSNHKGFGKLNAVAQAFITLGNGMNRQKKNVFTAEFLKRRLQS